MIIKISENKYYYKYMEIRENKDIYIIAPLKHEISERDITRIREKILNETRGIALDFNHIQNCSIDFINELIKLSKFKQIGAFNIPSDIFVLFNIMGVDKSIKMFVSELDFKENSRQLINRKFAII